MQTIVAKYLGLFLMGVFVAFVGTFVIPGSNLSIYNYQFHLMYRSALRREPGEEDESIKNTSKKSKPTSGNSINDKSGKKKALSVRSKSRLLSFNNRVGVLFSVPLTLFVLMEMNLKVEGTNFQEKQSLMCKDVIDGWIVKNTDDCNRGSGELGWVGTFSRGDFSSYASPPGCYNRRAHSQIYLHTRFDSQHPCTSIRGCLCWIGKVCSSIDGTNLNSKECMCGTKICTKGLYCDSTTSTCSSATASNTCTCSNGVKATGTACTTNNANICVSNVKYLILSCKTIY